LHRAVLLAVAMVVPQTIRQRGQVIMQDRGKLQAISYKPQAFCERFALCAMRYGVRGLCADCQAFYNSQGQEHINSFITILA
jgi:hypothetical protein